MSTNPVHPPTAERQTLGAHFIETAQRFADRTALIDSAGSQRTYAELLAQSIALSEVLAALMPNEPRVGVMLPPGEAGATVNLALALAGRASVNLNTTLDNAALAPLIAKADVRHVISSRRFLAALGRSSPLEDATLWIEEIVAALTVDQNHAASKLARLPASECIAACDRAGDAGDIATIIFSSGSTSAPKGVLLSHRNILSNALAMIDAFRFLPDDRLLGVLPLFHSFGYSVTLWAPISCGASALFHANPLDARAVGTLVHEHRATIALATPAFYMAWLRRCEPEQFESLRATVVGAQKLSPSLAAAWRERFGAELLEGYGCTELSPVVAVNLPDEPGARLRHKPGTIGRPLPGIEVQIRDPETGEPRRTGEDGVLWVRGPNVMQGYLGDPERTREVLVDGWYDTGDIAHLDLEGFLTITDRLSRFSKIGGEMVSHTQVEEALRTALRELAPDAHAEVCITAVNDEHKGERLVAVHTPIPIPFTALIEHARRAGVPNLFLPRADHSFEVAAMPQLGTGKLDLQGLRTIARERVARSSA